MREGGDDEAPLIGRYCGDTLPSEHVSSGNEIYVRFKTDHSVSGTGFRIRYDLSKVIQITYPFHKNAFDLIIKYLLFFNLICSLRRRIYKPVWSHYFAIPSRQLSKPANLYICDIPTEVYCDSSPISWFRCGRKPKLQFRLCSDKGWTRCQFHDHRQILWGSITYAIANSIYT